MKKIDLNNKKILALIIILIILVILFQSYRKILNKYRNDRIFALESEKYSKEVNNPVFKIDKIISYSDANIEDLSPKQNLSDINVSQFTDFAIYIDNTIKNKELSEQNTINNIYINNIGIIADEEEIGTKKLSTKNIEDLGKYIQITDSSKEIKYNVIHNNADKSLDSNSFYTDCSEPLILSYVNENIVKNKDVSGTGQKLSLDGSILSHLNIDMQKLNYLINFTINIENNLSEKYYCNCSINVDLNSRDGIGTGYIMQIFDLSKGDYRFKKH